MEKQTLSKNPIVENLDEYLLNSSESLHIVDGSGIILWANRTELDYLGYSEKEYIGQSITKFHRDSEIITDILTRLLSGETITNYSAYLTAKDGSTKRVLINSNGFWKNGQFIHTRCFSRDITNLKIPAAAGFLH